MCACISRFFTTISEVHIALYKRYGNVRLRKTVWARIQDYADVTWAAFWAWIVTRVKPLPPWTTTVKVPLSKTSNPLLFLVKLQTITTKAWSVFKGSLDLNYKKLIFSITSNDCRDSFGFIWFYFQDFLQSECKDFKIFTSFSLV